MGMTLEDAAYEQYISELREEFEEEYADEYRKEGEENFINRRLASYFMQNPDMDARARKRCEDARALLDVNYDACTVLACSAIEVGFKTLLLKPVICGFVNSDHVADLISTAIVSSKPDDKRLRGFLNVLFRNMTSVDLDSFEFGGQKRGLSGHIEFIQRKRNGVVHRAESVERTDAEFALDLAKLIVERLFPLLRNQMLALATSK